MSPASRPELDGLAGFVVDVVDRLGAVGVGLLVAAENQDIGRYSGLINNITLASIAVLTVRFLVKRLRRRNGTR